MINRPTLDQLLGGQATPATPDLDAIINPKGPGGYAAGSPQDLAAFVGKGALDFAKNTASGVARGIGGLGDFLYAGTLGAEGLPGETVEKLPLYNPKTTAGRTYQSAVAGATAAAPFGGVPALVGAAGGTTGQLAAEAGLPEWQRNLAALAPALFAPAAARAGQSIGSRFIPSMADDEAIRLLGKDVAPELKYGGTTPGDMTSRISAFPDQPTMPADVSRALQSRTEMLAQKVGPAKFTIEKALQDRDEQAGPQIVKTLSDTISNGGDVYSTMKALSEQQQANAAPLFEKAMNPGKTIHSDRLQQFLDDPLLQQGLEEGVKIQRLNALAEGKPFDPNDYTITYDDSGNLKFQPTPNMRTLQTAKIGLDNIIDKYRDPYGNLNLDQTGRAIVKVSRAFNDELRSLNPDYAAANDAWAGPAASKDALALGQKFRTMKPAELADRLADMTPSEKQFFLQGAAESLISKVEGASGNEARVVLGNKAIRDQLRPLFPTDEAYDSAIGRLQDVNRQFQTKTQALGNSRTAYRLSETPTGPSLMAPAAQAVTGLAAGEPVLGATGGLKFGANLLRRMIPENNAVPAAQARLLTETDPVRRQEIVRQIIDAATNRPRPFIRSMTPLLGTGVQGGMLSGNPPSLLGGP